MTIDSVSIGGKTDYTIVHMKVTNDLAGRNSSADITVFAVASGALYDDDDSVYDEAVYGDTVPEEMDEVIITNSDGDTVFGGFVTTVTQKRIDRTGVEYKLTAKDYNLLLETTLGSGSYTSQSDRAIMQAEFTANLPEIDTSSANLEIVQSSIDDFDAENLSLAEMMRRLTEITGAEYRVNYDKELHYFTPENNPATLQLSDKPHAANLVQFSEEFGTVGLSPETESSAAAASGTNWTNPTNAFAANDTYAVYNNTSQDDLILTTFGAAVPTQATILGIEVIVEGNGASGTAAQRQIQVGLTKDGAVLAGTRETGVQLPQTTDSEVTTGGSTSLWGTTWTPAELNATTFGVMIRDNDTTAAALNIDGVTVKVYYELWTANAVTVTDNAYASPGPRRAVLAEKIEETVANDDHHVSQTIPSVSAGQAYTLSCFFRAAERTIARLTIDGKTAYFDLANAGAVGTTDAGITGTSVESLEDGYYRLAASVLASGTSFDVEIGCAASDGTSSYAGTAGSGLYIWGAQVTQAAVVGTYGRTRKSTIAEAVHYDMTDYTGQFFTPANSVMVRGNTDASGNEIVVTRTDPASISEYGRTFEAVITNRSINNTTVAELYGDVELIKRSFPQRRGTVSTTADGFEVGQQVKVTNAARSLSETTFTIRGLVHEQEGPNSTKYTLNLGPVKTDLVQLIQQINRVAVADPEFPTAVPPPLSVGTDELQNDAVTSLKIAAQAVQEANLALASVTEDILAAAAVTETKIGPDAVTTPKIIAGAITSAELATGSVIAGKVAANTITGTEILAGSITAIDAVFATGAILEADIGDAEITTAKIGNAAITEAKIDNLAVTDAKIANATITAAKIVSLDANQINAGTMTAVNVSGGTFTLTSSPNTMTINGTVGFQQVHSTSGRTVDIINGLVDVQDGGTYRSRMNPTQFDIGNDALTQIYFRVRRDSTDGGYLELENNSNIHGAIMRADSNGGGALFIYSSNSTTSFSRPAVSIRGDGVIDLGLADSGYIAVNNEVVAARVEIGVDGGDNGYISVSNDAGNESVIVGSDNNLGQADSGYVACKNTSGTVVAEMGADASGEGRCVATGSTLADVLAFIDSTHYSLARAHSTAALNGLYVNGLQVVGPQGATISDPSGGSTIDAEARTAIDTIIDRLQAHGLIA